MSLLDKWVSQELTHKDIKAWILKQYLTKELLTAKLLTDEDVAHVATCLRHIYLWYHGEGDLGHFLTAVVTNNFSEACGRADKANTLLLSIYATYLYNHAPMNYKQKVKTL